MINLSSLRFFFPVVLLIVLAYFFGYYSPASFDSIETSHLWKGYTVKIVNLDVSSWKFGGLTSGFSVKDQIYLISYSVAGNSCGCASVGVTAQVFIDDFKTLKSIYIDVAGSGFSTDVGSAGASMSLTSIPSSKSYSFYSSGGLKSFSFASQRITFSEGFATFSDGTVLDLRGSDSVFLSFGTNAGAGQTYNSGKSELFLRNIEVVRDSFNYQVPAIPESVISPVVDIVNQIGDADTSVVSAPTSFFDYILNFLRSFFIKIFGS